MSSRGLLVQALLVCAASAGHAQVAARAGTTPLFVNDEAERYARMRQVAGDAPLYPWSIRPFSQRESARLSNAPAEHPWSDQTETQPRTIGPVSVKPLLGEARIFFNSSFPYGYNDGAVWAGRGLTTVLQGGGRSSWRNLSLTLAPIAFRSENSPFTLRNNGATGPYAFGDAFQPHAIDQPQRFGASAYQRIDAGNSSLQFDARAVTFGFSTANQHWGPARDHPLLLGNNAAGFPHAFVGTGEPVNIFIGRAHARIMWGRLEMTPYSIMREEPHSRFTTGMAAVFQPRGVPGLELGFGRFFHIRWMPGVVNLANVTRSFIGIVRDSRVTADDPLGNEPDNQIASIFGRWVLPRSGFELYGEFGKDDYNKNLRDLAMEPDHLGGYLLGFQRVMKRPAQRYFVIRAEVLNTRISPLAINRPQSPFYIHGPLRQGHTHLGQTLGSVGGVGGGAATVGVDRFTPGGRTTVTWSRILRAEFRDPSGTVDPHRADLFHTLGVDGVVFRGRVQATYEVTAAYEMNRDHRRDAFNLRTAAGLRYAW